MNAKIRGASHIELCACLTASANTSNVVLYITNGIGLVIRTIDRIVLDFQIKIAAFTNVFYFWIFDPSVRYRPLVNYNFYRISHTFLYYWLLPALGAIFTAAS